MLLVCLILALIVIMLYGTKELFKNCSVLKTIRTTQNENIQVVDDECLEGMPHTTDNNTIRVTRSCLHSHNFTNTLSHERVHLDQKRNPGDWKEFYNVHWSYDIQNKPPENLPEMYKNNIRPNPDTELEPWALWRDRYLFFPVFSNNEIRSLKSPIVKVWDMFENRIVDIPDEWKKMFCKDGSCPYQSEHPHEIAAELLTHDNHSLASARLRKWLNK